MRQGLRRVPAEIRIWRIAPCSGPTISCRPTAHGWLDFRGIEGRRTSASLVLGCAPPPMHQQEPALKAGFLLPGIPCWRGTRAVLPVPRAPGTAPETAPVRLPFSLSSPLALTHRRRLEPARLLQWHEVRPVLRRGQRALALNTHMHSDLHGGDGRKLRTLEPVGETIGRTDADQASMPLEPGVANEGGDRTPPEHIVV